MRGAKEVGSLLLHGRAAGEDSAPVWFCSKISDGGRSATVLFSAVAAEAGKEVSGILEIAAHSLELKG